MRGSRQLDAALTGTRWVWFALFSFLALACLLASSATGLLSLPFALVCAGLAIWLSRGSDGRNEDDGASSVTGGRLQVLAVVLVVIGGVGSLYVAATALFGASSPETPGNAVVDLRMAIQLNDGERVRGRVCAEARNTARKLPFGYEDLEDKGSYFGTGVANTSSGESVVFGDIAVNDGLDYEIWAFELVLEDQRWKVCRIRPPTADELSQVSAERAHPPPAPR